MKIAFGCDHRGFLLKEPIIAYLKEAGHEVVDAGCYSSERADYPVYGEKVGRLVASGECRYGVLVCGTGSGISMAANAVRGIYAICCSDLFTAEYTRRHNNANVVAMGANVVGPGLAVEIVDKFIHTEFEGERHMRRLAMIKEIEMRNDPVSGKERMMNINGRTMRFLNQRCREWSHLYEYQGSGCTLSTSGCGIFSTCHAVEYLCGERINVEELGDFSCSVGGRGDDGTNRPMLLKGMVEAGLDKKYGFRYDVDSIVWDVCEGHINDHEKLWDCLSSGGAALCNLRLGHIVTLAGTRVVDGQRQVLAIDCHSESADERIRDKVLEVIPGTEIRFPVYNASGLMTGVNSSYGAFWVALETPMNFDLLYKR